MLGALFIRLRQNNSNLLPLLSVLLLAMSLLIFVNLTSQKQELGSKAAITLVNPFIQKSSPAYVSGELIVKFKPNTVPIKLNQQAVASGKSLDTSSASFTSLDVNTIPKSLSALNKSQKIITIEKVFKQLNIKAPSSTIIDPLRTYKVSIGSGSVITALRYLSNFSEVGYVEPNLLLKASVLSNDPYYVDQTPPAPERTLAPGAGGWNPSFDYQWALKKINVEPAWSKTLGSSGITVAVIDTGVDYNHPELTERVINGHNFVVNSEDSMDDNGHGTHVSGIVGAKGNNSLGIAGVNWVSRILAVKALDSGGSGSITNLAAAIDYARSNGVKVINASWGGTGSSQTLKDVIDSVTNSGVIFVAAAGNSGADSRYTIPAGYRNVISVGSSDVSDQTSDFSNRIGIDFVAPGGDSSNTDPQGLSFRNILSLRAHNTGNLNLIIGTDYLRQAGTSMAAPFVTGAVSLLLSQNNQLTLEEVRGLLRQTAYRFDKPIWRSDRGYGRIDIGKAISQPVTGVARIQKPDGVTISGDQLPITFLAYGKSFTGWVIEYGIGNDPNSWNLLSQSSTLNTVAQTVNANISILTANNTYTIRLRLAGSTNTIVEDRIIVAKSPPIKWSFSVPGGSFYLTPAISDIDEDGKKEIIAASNLPNMFVINSDGSLRTTINLGNEVAYRSYGSPIVATILPQLGKKQILITTTAGVSGSDDGHLRLFSASGNEYIGDGWPVNLGILADAGRPIPPRVVDIDGDGMNEVLIGAGNKIYVLDSKGLPKSAAWPKVINGYLANTVYAGKFFEPNSNVLQILSANDQGNINIFDVQGNQVSAFNIPSFSVSGWKIPPAVSMADLDSDGLQEIIIKNYSTGGDIYTAGQTISVYKANGTKLWERNIAPEGFNSTYPMPIVSDINGDGSKKVIVSDLSGLWVFDKDGKDVTNWPFYSRNEILNFVTADSDGDNKLEIYYSQSWPPALGALDNGIEKFSFPIFETFVLFDPPAVYDINSDNHLEMIIALPFGGPLRAYDLGSSKLNYKFRTGWPQFQFDESRISEDGICLKLLCDINRDGIENLSDGSFFRSCFLKSNPLGACRTADVGGNGTVGDVCNGYISVVDFSLISTKCPQIFQTVTPTIMPSATPTPTLSLTPTPLPTNSPIPFHPL